MSRTELIDLIVLLIDNNNANQIDYSRMRQVLEEFVDTVLPEATAETDGRVPYVDSEAYTSSDALKVLGGIVKAQKLNLTSGIPYADYIYDRGTFSGVAARTLVTKRWIETRGVVRGIVEAPISVAADLVVGNTITLQGGISHVIVDGDSFLLKGQADPDENIVYVATTDETAVAVNWYDPAKNQEILVELGPTSKVSMPAVEEGNPPEVLVPNQSAQLVLDVDDWAANTLELATGDLKILATSLILVSPATKSDSDLWAMSEVFCASQDVDELTFSCATVPTGDITINVIVL